MAASGKSSGLDLSRLRAQRVSTGSVGASGMAVVTVTWDTPFADANYSVAVSVLDTPANESLQIAKIESQTAAAITVRVKNVSLGARTGTLHAIGIHD